jgi:hypothetical protein
VKTKSEHQRALADAERARKASADREAARAKKVDPRAFWEVVRDELWAEGVVNTWIGYQSPGTAQVVACDHEALSRGILREDRVTLERAVRVLGSAGFEAREGKTPLGIPLLLVTRPRSQMGFF